MFSGTFKAAMSVRQVPDQRVLLFDLVEPGFMQEFEGRWKVSMMPAPSLPCFFSCCSALAPA